MTQNTFNTSYKMLNTTITLTLVMRLYLLALISCIPISNKNDRRK